MSKIYKKGAANSELNMTPLIDVTFQLIIFFMLVNNIVAQEAVQMIVPQLTDPKTRELGEVDNRMVVNIAPGPYENADRQGENVLNIDGRAVKVVIANREFDPTNLQGITDFLKEYKAEKPEGLILLRADAGLSYESVQPVMSAVTAAGISKINLVAYMPDKGPEDQGQGERPASAGDNE